MLSNKNKKIWVIMLIIILSFTSFLNLIFTFYQSFQKPDNLIILKKPELKNVYKIVDNELKIDDYLLQKELLIDISKQIKPLALQNEKELKYSYNSDGKNIFLDVDFDYKNYKWFYFLKNII